MLALHQTDEVLAAVVGLARLTAGFMCMGESMANRLAAQQPSTTLSVVECCSIMHEPGVVSCVVSCVVAVCVLLHAYTRACIQCVCVCGIGVCVLMCVCRCV
jgi:hypothetical protein